MAVLVLVVLPLLAISVLGSSDDSDTAETAGTDGRSSRELRSGSYSRSDEAPAPDDAGSGGIQFEDGMGNEWDVEFGDHETEGIEELPDGWTRFSHPSGAFVVELPGTPSRIELSGAHMAAYGIEAHNWQVIGFRGDVAVLTWIPAAPALAAGLETDLEATIDGYVMGAELSSGAQFLDEQVLDVSGHPARLFRIEGPDADGALLLVFADTGILSLTLFARDGDHAALANRALSGVVVD